MRDKDFDLVVFGATGFTGRLVAEYLHGVHGALGAVRWALAGRSLDKLARVRQQIGASDNLPLLRADAADAPALAALAARSRVIISTVGPYQLYGEPLLRACADAGTDYVDLCGEPAWMAQMIARHQAAAQASGARIVFSCGFDSIPFDLGVLYLQSEALRRFGAPLQRVRGRVRVMKGGLSGGTLASALATMEAAGRDPALARLLADPFALTPGFRGPPQPAGETAAYDPAAHSWTGPFVMAAINTKNVHRTHALRGHAWGRDFSYDERLLTGDGPAGRLRAHVLAGNTRLQNLALGAAPARALLRRMLPQPGQGPSRREREAGRYEVQFSGETAAGQTLAAVVRGDRDPGYGSTCKLIAESALCLLQQVDRGMAGGGIWTPGAAMGLVLVRRLQERAGLRFAVEETANAESPSTASI
jgi:short subunit dehydrogenase-like uncharacterized protein